MSANRRDPVAMMLAIAERFLTQAAELNRRVGAAIEAGASHSDLVCLMNLAATDRLRALSAAQAAAPFCSPKLQAIEVAPAAESTVSRFEARLAAMAEDDVLAHLRRIAAGAMTLEAIEAEATDAGTA
jgi:hypothetical protein